MSWSTIRLIWLRELRDQLRDRRTLVTMFALPLLLYPLLMFVATQFAGQLVGRPSVIGVVRGADRSLDFPQRLTDPRRHSPLPALSWLALSPAPGSFPASLAAAASLECASRLSLDYPLLIDRGRVPLEYQKPPQDSTRAFATVVPMQFHFLDGDGAAELAARKVDLVLAAPPDFMDRLARGEQPCIELRGRPDDERSRRAAEQLTVLLDRWERHLKEVRFRREGVPARFDDPFEVMHRPTEPSAEAAAALSLFDMLMRTFPVLLVLWSLVGALHPAIDICAGEKERGTMETLLISPAGRAEIVYGKFLTIWVFSAATAVMHLASMSLSTWQLREQLPQGAVTLPALFWCVLLVLPLSALFSAVCLAVGAYARSSKEGQYYLMPLLWLTLPLVFLTMAPDVELNQLYAMVPVTGVVLLIQRLMIAPSLGDAPWFYFLPVFGTVVLYSWLALRWAIWQFQREEVLFRSSDRLDVGLLLRALFRKTEAQPGFGQALLCFAVLLALRWLSLDVGGDLPLLLRSCIVLLAFVAAPALFMALMLTTRPLQGLSLSWPRLGYVLAALLLLPLAELAHYTLMQVPSLFELFQDRRSFVVDAYRRFGGEALGASWGYYVLVLGFLPAVCKELAFRGFILSGLRHRLPVVPAILLSGFLFAVFHMNVFALAPLFLLGIVAGALTVRSGSLVPAIILHTGCNYLMLHGSLLPNTPPGELPFSTALGPTVPALAALLCGGTGFFLLWKNGKTGVLAMAAESAGE